MKLRVGIEVSTNYNESQRENVSMIECESKEDIRCERKEKDNSKD